MELNNKLLQRIRQTEAHGAEENVRALIEKVIQEPIWSMRFTMDRPISGISIGGDGDSILFYPNDATEPYQIFWSSDRYWGRACDFLEESGISGELEEGHSSEFRMFKNLLIDGTSSGKLTLNDVCVRDGNAGATAALSLGVKG